MSPTTIQAQSDAEMWQISKMRRCFSTLPTNQALQQEVKELKEAGGEIGLTNRPAAMDRFTLTVRTMAGLIQQFEDGAGFQTVDTDVFHHDENPASPVRLETILRELLLILTPYNPFKECSKDLVTLDGRMCQRKNVVQDVFQFEEAAHKQCEYYTKLI